MSIVTELLSIVFACMIIALGVEDPGATGAQKRAAALAKIRAILDDPKEPLNWPPFLRAYEDTLLGMCIDAAVALINRTSFFGHSAAGSAPSGSPSTQPAPPAPAQ